MSGRVAYPCADPQTHRPHYWTVGGARPWAWRCPGVEAPATPDLAEVLLAQPREVWRSVPAPLHIRLGQ